MGRVGRCTAAPPGHTVPTTANAVPAWRLAEKGKPGVTRGRKATGLARLVRTGASSQPGCRSQEVGVSTARPLLGALARVLAVVALALAASASARPI